MPSIFDSFPDFMTQPDPTRMVISATDPVGNVLCSYDSPPLPPGSPPPPSACMPPQGGTLRVGYGKSLSTVGYVVLGGGLYLLMSMLRKKGE